MPYIKDNMEREALDVLALHLVLQLKDMDVPGQEGKLAYVLYSVLVQLFEKNRRFQRLRSITGEWEWAWKCFVEFHGMPHEAKKRKENGDVI